jgi:hypothetical protein
MMMDKSSKNRLTERERFLFQTDSLFDRIGRAVCDAGFLPRKELFEAWETARRVRRRFRGGRIVELACGHGLAAHIMLLLDDSSKEAIAVDPVLSDNAYRLSDILTERWPRLKNRVHFMGKPLQAIELLPDDLVLSVHACGELTDLVIDRAAKAGARIAVLPCCHNVKQSDTGGLSGWLSGPLAVDVMRAVKLRTLGYRILTVEIPNEVTPKNRLLIAEKISECK